MKHLLGYARKLDTLVLERRRRATALAPGKPGVGGKIARASEGRHKGSHNSTISPFPRCHPEPSTANSVAPCIHHSRSGEGSAPLLLTESFTLYDFDKKM